MAEDIEDTATLAYHIGAHKTGTSLLQSYLTEHRPLLRSRRVLYMGRGVADVIARAGEDPEVAAEAKEHLRKYWGKRDSYDTFLASFEDAIGPPFLEGLKDRGLYPQSAERIASLVETLRPFRPRILFSIRPVGEFVESYYLQSVHQGGYLDFDEWLGRHVDFERLSWQPIVDNLVSAFRADAVDVVDFRLIKTLGTEGYLRELLGRLLPGTDLEVGTRAVSNASIADKGLRLALAANPHLRGKDEQIAMRRFLQRRFSNLRYERPILLSNDQKQWLHDRYSSDYDELVAGKAGAARARSAPVTTGPDLVLQLGPSHDATIMLRVSLTGLRPQLREHGIAFVVLAPDDSVQAVQELVAAERAVAHSHRTGPVLVCGLLSRSTADGSGPYPGAAHFARGVVDATGATRVSVVLHVERQDHLMERAYADAVLAGASHELTDLFPKRRGPLFDFGVVAQQLHAVPGVVEVRVRPVERAFAGSVEFVEDVLAAAGLRGKLDLSAVPSAVPISRRLTARGLRIAAAMNAHLDDDDERASVRESLLEHFAASGANAAHPAGVLRDKQRARILRAYAPVNRWLFTRYVPDLPADTYRGDTDAEGEGYATSADRPSVRRSNSS